MKEERLYTTGEVAKMFAIKKDTLFYYDKIGLFSPVTRKGSTSYRYYSSKQLKILDTIISMRDMGVSIDELKEYIKDISSDSFLDLMDVEVKKLDSIINEYTIKKKTIQATAKHIIDAKTKPLNTLLITQEDTRHFFSLPIIHTGKGYNEDWNKTYEKIWERINSAKIITMGSILSKDAFLGSSFEDLSYVVGYTIFKNSGSAPKGMYANYYVKGNNQSLLEGYRDFKNKIEKEGLLIASDIHEEYSVEALSEKNEKDFITHLFVKIENAAN